MVVRYGWPSRVLWPGSYYNESWSIPSPPFTTAGYSAGRVHLVPAWTTVEHPLAAGPGDWELNSSRPDWWPVEHALLRRSVTQITDDQHVFLRRDTSALFAYAAERVQWPAESSADSVFAAVVRSTGPDSVQIAAKQLLTWTSRIALRAMIPPGPALLGVEVVAQQAPGAVRTRFGVQPPPTLATLGARERAISQPVFLEVPVTATELPSDPNRALNAMLGSSSIAQGAKLGVYWDTYGFAATDSVTLAIQVQRVTPQSALRTLGIAVNIATDLNTPIAISWTEPQPGHSAQFIGGVVPIGCRSVILDTSALPAGDYAITVVAAMPGREPVMGTREITVR
jgi:hypothetical protein